MKKILFIVIALCNLVASAQLLPITDAFKMAECGNNSCMFTLAKENGFAAEDESTPASGSGNFHFSKNREDINSSDILLLGVASYMNSVTLNTSDTNIEEEYKRLVASKEFKETSVKKSSLGGVDHNFTSAKFPGYSATLNIGTPFNGMTHYELYVCRFLQ